MKVNGLNSNGRTHTSSNRSDDIVDALESVKSALGRIENNTAKAANPLGLDTDSPYATDRPSHNPHRIKGTQKELEWKKVSISREQQLKEVTDEDNIEIAANHSLSKKLNIL